MKKLIVVATELELSVKEIYREFGLEVLVTGVGKINSTFILTKFLTGLQYVKNGEKITPDLIINYGTAGSKNIPIGTLVDCTKFFQRDMDVMPITGVYGATPFENNVPTILDYSHIDNPINKHLLCGTGDNFVTNSEKHVNSLIDVYDMEAYALAKVCWRFKIDFVSYKYITDNVNEKSAKNWVKNCADGAILFKELLKNIK